jgi:hypothetical protein
MSDLYVNQNMAVKWGRYRAENDVEAALRRQLSCANPHAGWWLLGEPPPGYPIRPSQSL